jgi:rubredoxin
MNGKTGTKERGRCFVRVGTTVIALTAAFVIVVSAAAMAAGKDMARYTCQFCGYVYDPGKGDASQNIPPGTSFDDLPDTWKCPDCGMGKSVFVRWY